MFGSTGYAGFLQVVLVRSRCLSGGCGGMLTQDFRSCTIFLVGLARDLRIDACGSRDLSSSRRLTGCLLAMESQIILVVMLKSQLPC